MIESREIGAYGYVSRVNAHQHAGRLDLEHRDVSLENIKHNVSCNRSTVTQTDRMKEMSACMVPVTQDARALHAVYQDAGRVHLKHRDVSCDDNKHNVR